MNKKAKIFTVLTVMALMGTGVALASHGHESGHRAGGGCFKKTEMGVNDDLSRHHRKHFFNRMLKNIPQEKQQEARAVHKKFLDETLDLRQRMMNDRFDFKRAVRGETWNEEQIQAKAQAMSQTRSEMMVKRARLKYEMSQLMASSGQPSIGESE
ncbi:MAG: periplasmic heavy metal sensor [Magnetococcales bacterium]|nr:periplasmic heavy metal sensor [Magnetococcales bacterium]